MKSLLLGSIMVFGLANTANAVDARYYEIKSVKIQEVQDLGFGKMGNLDTAEENPADQIKDGLKDADVILDQIINLGKKIWSLVEANRPVYSYKFDNATALPKGVTEWQQLETWSAPETHAYRATYENAFGVNVVDFTYRVAYVYGGSFKSKGRYLANVTVMPANLDVAWGYTFHAEGGVPMITNAGTSESPVAGAQIQLKWTVDTVMKHSENTVSYYVDGKGMFKDLNQ